VAHIEARDVSVDFPLWRSEQRSLKRLLSTPLRSSRFGTDDRQRLVLHALTKINLKIEQGERVALIGPNGAGKSTLLRVLAGIYPPISGAVEMNGRIGSLLSSGLGMRDDVSGFDNIEFCLLLQGVPHEEISVRRDEVAAFTELGEYLNLHVGAYSAGMRLRLAFAISTAIDPEILIIDEMFGGGDASFFKKAETRLIGLMQRSKILVLASHSTALAERFCTRGVWLDNGIVRQNGDVTSVIREYLASVT
jgi:ABC-type polysaccharide/polyol phosphate transport system ATPase subunit